MPLRDWVLVRDWRGWEVEEPFGVGRWKEAGFICTVGERGDRFNQDAREGRRNK